jgi:uncharacterized protein YcgI (DUF1989 family)
MDDLVEIPARKGKAVPIAKGRSVKVINTHGTQVVDIWAFNNDGIFPKAGDALVSNRRRPILTLIEDTSPGIHDTLLAACDEHRYRLLGCEEGHANCTDNLHLALAEIAFTVRETPSPLNLWMNIPVLDGGTIDYLPPVSKPGDYVVIRAEMDVVVAFSACPQDMVPVNGEACMPVAAHFTVI